MSYQKKILPNPAYSDARDTRNPVYFETEDTDVDAPIPSYDTLTPAYETPRPLYHTGQLRWESTQRPRINTAWSTDNYDIIQPTGTEYDEIIGITRRMHAASLSQNYDSIVAITTLGQAQPTLRTPSYFQRFKTFVWNNAQRRVATVVITGLVIGGIIGAYLGLSSSGSAHSSQHSDNHNCTYPEGVNATFNQLQETFSAQNSSLTIPGLDPATCSLISTVINNTVHALKVGGYACWQNVQSALMPLASSAIALNMDSIQQIITAVQQYCFASSSMQATQTSSVTSSASSTSSTAMTSSTPVTSPANTLTTFTTTPMTNAPTTITTTTTTSEAGTTAITTSVAPSTTSTSTTTTTTPTTTVTSTVSSTSPTTLQTTTTSLINSSDGTTMTLVPSTTTTVPAGTTTITTVSPTSSSTVFVSSSVSTTVTTSTMTTTPLKTTTLSAAQTTTTLSASTSAVSTNTTTTSAAPTTTNTTSTMPTMSTLPCCQFNVCLTNVFVGCRCTSWHRQDSCAYTTWPEVCTSC